MNILPKILATLVQHPRQVFRWDEIEWSDTSLTFNLFRLYEYVFGRRDGIKAECSSALIDGKQYQAFHSWEAAVVYGEHLVCKYFASLSFVRFHKGWPSLRFPEIFTDLFPVGVRIFIPIMKTPEGFPVFASPYLFAIAFDAGSGIGATQPGLAHTCTGSNRMLISLTKGDTTDTLTSYQYAGIDMVNIDKRVDFSAGTAVWVYNRGLKAPTTGTNNIVTAGNTNNQGVGASYSGVIQNNPPLDSFGYTSGGPGTTATGTTTVVATNCWLVGCYQCDQNVTANGTGTARTTLTQTIVAADSNGTVGTGSQSITMTLVSADWNVWTSSIAPAATTTVVTPLSMLTLLGVG